MLFPLTAKPAAHFYRFTPPLAVLRKRTFNLNGCLLYGNFSKTLFLQYLFEDVLWQIEFNFIIIGYCTNCHIFIILPAVTIFNLPTEKLSSSTNPTDGILVLFRRAYRKAYRREDTKWEEQTKNIIKKQ